MKFIEKHQKLFLGFILSLSSIGNFIYYYVNSLGFLYNDAKSHLDIGRRVVENLTPGFAQLGGVWLPLPHLLMLPTIWNNFMWHSGLSGALPSMASYVALGILIYLFLKRLSVGILGRIAGLLAFSLNINILYMQSTAMTELLLLATMTAGCYELMVWHKKEKLYPLIKAAFWIMLATLIRYDGWFLFGVAVLLVLFHALRRFGLKAVEGIIVPFVALGGFGIALWLLWNQVIFKDALYFVFGQYSAHEQQRQFEQLGTLTTKHNLLLSVSAYVHAVVSNAGWFISIAGAIGALLLWFDKNINISIRIATFALIAPLFFNILSLYLGFSVLFVPQVTGDTWFNARYGLMMVPALAIFFGYFVQRMKPLRFFLVGILVIISLFAISIQESVVIQDAKYGGSGYDVTKISEWLATHVEKDDYLLVSTASHDQIIFSSGLDMKRFVHQGTGYYWDLTVAHPDRYVRFIVMRTGDDTDLVYRMLSENESFKKKYAKAGSYFSADVYELKSEYRKNLQPFPQFDNIIR